MQKKCTFTIHSKDCVSCIMMHGLMYRMFLDKLKTKKGEGERERERERSYFFNQNVKCVKILMMSGMPLRFYVVDLRHLYTSAMIT